MMSSVVDEPATRCWRSRRRTLSRDLNPQGKWSPRSCRRSRRTRERHRGSCCRMGPVFLLIFPLLDARPRGNRPQRAAGGRRATGGVVGWAVWRLLIGHDRARAGDQHGTCEQTALRLVKLLSSPVRSARSLHIALDGSTMCPPWAARRALGWGTLFSLLLSFCSTLGCAMRSNGPILVAWMRARLENQLCRLWRQARA